MVWVGADHPMASCRAYAKRGHLVCFETNGPPGPGQHAHHIDGDKQNDAPGNLEWRDPTEHGRHHLSPERARKLGRKGGKKAAKLRAQSLDGARRRKKPRQRRAA